MIATEENNMFAFLFTNLHPSLIAIKLIFPSQARPGIKVADIERRILKVLVRLGLGQTGLGGREVLPLHFVNINCPTVVNVVHLEAVLDLLLRRSVHGDVQSQHELPKSHKMSFIPHQREPYIKR